MCSRGNEWWRDLAHMATMKAVVRNRYGPPEILETKEVETPVPGANEVLIEVAAASVNRSDWESLVGRPLYARIGTRQSILGTDFAGRVVDIGSEVTSFEPGDEVFGDVMYHGGGTFAEFVCVPESAPLVHKPSGISFREAATLPQAGMIAIQGIPQALRSGDRVLINGAGGGSGAFAIQLAKSAGAHVTAVDNTGKQGHMSSLGADRVIDHTTVDYTRQGSQYDLILDVFCERSMFAVRRALAPGGSYAVAGGSVPALLSAATIGRLLSTGGRRIAVLMVKPNKDDLNRLANMMSTGDLVATIEQVFPLEGVPDALRRVGAGTTKGKLVIAPS